MKESMVETEVTYPLEWDGKFVLIEQVPARVSSETGEQFFPRRPSSKFTISSTNEPRLKRRSKRRFTSSFDPNLPHFTSSQWLALWLLNSGAYMLWMFAMPVW